MWPNLRHLGEALGGAKGQLKAVSFKKATDSVCRIRIIMLKGSEFQTE